MNKIESEFEVGDLSGYQKWHEARKLKLKPGEKKLV